MKEGIYLSEMLLLCVLASIGCYVMYLIIKIAVKHAISENLKDISFIIKDAIF